jgi:hypothetical protein
MVQSTVKHPAILGYCVGNEIFDGMANNSQFWTNYGKLLDRATAAGKKWDANPFLMTAVNDEFTPETSWPAMKGGEQSGKLKNLDAWGLNCYRGKTFGGSGNSIFLQYKDLMTLLNKKKPLILGEWGTSHSTRGPDVYGKEAKPTDPTLDLDSIPDDQMGPDRTYKYAEPTSSFMATQWSTIKGNIASGKDQVCVGGFIFDWADEYWKANDPNNHVGGPNQHFTQAFAGGYWDEAWFGINSAVPFQAYGSGKPQITRQQFKAYGGVKTFYKMAGSTPMASELYGAD